MKPITTQFLWRLEQCLVNAKTEEAKRKLFKFTVNILMNEQTQKKK